MRLYEIRKKSKSPFWITMLFCVMFLIIGAAAGIISKLSDSASEIIGNITSAMGIWIFICVTICSFTKSPLRAAAYVFSFCAAMIAGYYLTAELGDLYYSSSYVKGWSVFTLLTPIFAFAAWFARGKGKLPWVLRIGIVFVTVCAVFVFPGYIIIEVLFAVGAAAVTLVKEKDNNNFQTSIVRKTK